MNKIKVMTVDDSSFSRTVLAELLESNNCDVVGEAESFDTLIDTYDRCKPDLVTMDIAMPGKDGFECSSELLLHDKSAKILLISSMKDEETELKAKHIGIAGYLQKPVEAEHLNDIINKILSPDVLYENLIEWSFDIFQENLSQNITKLTKSTAELSTKETTGQNISLGVTAVIGIIGMYSGKLIVDMSTEAAEKMTELILKRPSKNNNETISMVAEFANIIGGIACSMLNKKEKSLSLRVAPPSVFQSESSTISNPNVEMRTIIAKTEFGDIELCFGFQKGSTIWM